MSYKEAHQEPYTKYPNRYNDTLKPLLTDTQRDICDVVIRMTYGWHHLTAAISNATFARKARKSIPGIIKAKKQLEAMGLLIVIRRGGGSRKGEYMLDLWYDHPNKSVKASIIPQDEQIQEMQAVEDIPPSEEQEDILELPEASSAEEPQAETEDSQNCDTPETHPVEPESHAPEEPDSEPISPAARPEISGWDEASNPDSEKDYMEVGGKLSLPPSIMKDLSNISRSKEKHTVGDTKAEGEKPKKKKAAATVRYRFLSLFPEAGAEDDWQFFGWAAREYGLKACISKLDYMREHRKQHGITNPKGFFRTALVRDFQPPAFIMAKLKADERAEQEVEHRRRESQEWENMVADFSYEKAAASLQKLLNTLG